MPRERQEAARAPPRTGRPARVPTPPRGRSECRAARGLVPLLPPATRLQDARQRHRESEGASVSFPVLSRGTVVGIVGQGRDVTELAGRFLAGLWAFLHALAT